MSEENYYKNLPKKRMAAGLLLFNSGGELLILKPIYKDHWLIPGGVVEKNESPKEACTRETKEELNLYIEPKRLLCVDYCLNQDEPGESLQFVFHGGILTPAQIDEIKINPGEISHYQFMKSEDALPLLSKGVRLRVAKSLKAIKNNTVLYLENGKVIPKSSL